ncbi:MAG: hypothetical protein LBR74_05645 [Eubacterium sp.]|nr:hypothetical protein [Eubacterium sp.]
MKKVCSKYYELKGKLLWGFIYALIIGGFVFSLYSSAVYKNDIFTILYSIIMGTILALSYLKITDGY